MAVDRSRPAISPRVVNLHLARLLEGGYIRKIGSGDGAPAGYCVLKSKKWTNRLHPAAETGNREEDYSATEKNSSDGENISSRTEKKTTETEKNSSPIYRNDTLQHKTTAKTKSKTAPFAVPAWLPLDSWNAYLEMRQQKRKVPSEYAKHLVIRELDKLRASGHSIATGRISNADNSGRAKTGRNIDSLKQAMVNSGDYAPGYVASEDGCVVPQSGTKSGNLW
jgi:hypothetical protein